MVKQETQTSRQTRAATALRFVHRLKVGQAALWWAVAAIVAAWLLWMTLRPNPTVAGELGPLVKPASAHSISPHLLIGLAGNVVVFIPLGTAVALALGGSPPARRWLGTAAAGASLSLLIELVQTGIPSRVAAVDDWLLNTAGSALGALLAELMLFARRKRARKEKRDNHLANLQPVALSGAGHSRQAERVCKQAKHTQPDETTEA